MRALIDGDILVYNIGWGVEKEEYASWDIVEETVRQRVDYIVNDVQGDLYDIFLSSPGSFRHDLYTEYKQGRAGKPWHYVNIRNFMVNILGANISRMSLEADDEMAIEAVKDPDTVICSLDKDLKQIPANFYSWEFRDRGSYGPELHTNEGWLSYENGKLTGCGYPWFASQVLIGDTADNYKGLIKVGPKKAYDILKDCFTYEDYEQAMEQAYEERKQDDFEVMCNLAWICRREDEQEQPLLWERKVYS